MKQAKNTARAVKYAAVLLLGASLAASLAGCGDSSNSQAPAASAGASASPGGAAAASGNPYAAAGIEDPEAFRHMFLDVKDAAARGDKEKAASCALYPIRVNVGKVAVEVKTKEDFVKWYDRIFTEDVRKALAAQDPDKLFASEDGVMAGTRGEIWFGATSSKPQQYGIVIVNAGDSPRR